MFLTVNIVAVFIFINVKFNEEPITTQNVRLSMGQFSVSDTMFSII